VTGKELSRGLRRGLFLKIGRGFHTRKDFSADFDRQIMLVCKRVPSGVVCLSPRLSTMAFLPLDSASIWMAIDFKAKKPMANGLKLHFVRFSGQAPHTRSGQYEDRWSFSSYLQRSEEYC
jgi:hypothetical protein